MAYTKYSLTPANNNSAPPDGAPEGMLPSAVNDTMRDMMAQIRDCGDGIRDGTYTMTAAKITGGTITGATINNSAIGGTTAAAGAFTTLSATGATTFSGAAVVSGSLTANTFSSSGSTITGGSINSTTIGASTASTGKFTTLEATGFNAASSFGFKNRIINGAMVIDQRNAGASVTPVNNGYVVDRWKFGLTQASKFTAQQSSTAPTGFINSLLMTSSSAYSVGSGDTFFLDQCIEGLNVTDLAWGTANAKTVTLSFWVRSSLTGQFGGAFRNSNANRCYPFSYTISSANTWEQKSIVVAGDTSGTWLTTNGVGIELVWDLGSGSTYLATAGTWASGNFIGATGDTSVVGTNGATFYITGVQLEVGSTATSFDYRPYGTELALCQRYLPAFNYTNSGNGSSVCTAVQYSGTVLFANIPFLVQARVSPTGATITGSAIAYPSGNTSTASAYNNSSLYVGQIQFTLSGTTGQAQDLRANSSTLQILFTGCEL